MADDVTYGLSKDFVFSEAIEFLKTLTPLPREEYVLLGEECRSKAFTVTGYTKLEILQQFLDEITKAVEDGQTKETFRKRMNTFLKDHGYEKMNPWKSDTIFRTNLQTAYQAGHYQSMSNPTAKKLRPYWQYRTAGDQEVREAHRVMESRIYRADDPIWDVWYPPNGFRCRCSVVSLSKAQVERKGLRIEEEPPKTLDKKTGKLKTAWPDQGFSNNPAKDQWKPAMQGISPPLQTIYKECQKESKSK